jgi:hypothetical protein
MVENAEFSGYWVSSLMCPWVPAREIIDNFYKKDPEYFSTKVLGLPYVGGGNKVLKQDIMQNLTSDFNDQSGHVVIGVDTGIDIRYVIGNNQGLFYYGETSDYKELERLLYRFPKAIMVIDQGGDIIGPRTLREKFRGRIFLCHYSQDRKTMQMIRWGDGDEDGNVIVDRNRAIQLVVDEFKGKRIPIFGTENEWNDYWLHWSHIYRVAEEDALGVKKTKWMRSDRDDWCHATLYWRVGMEKGGGDGGIIKKASILGKRESVIDGDGHITGSLIQSRKTYDWRKI